LIRHSAAAGIAATDSAGEDTGSYNDVDLETRSLGVVVAYRFDGPFAPDHTGGTRTASDQCPIMLLISLSPLRLRKCLGSVVACIGFTSICCFAHTMFFAVDSTPYDHQMVRAYPTLVPAAHYPATWLSLITINQWMSALRAIPYQYSNQWKTPAEVQSAQTADCKGKALLLYEKMQAMGARNFRLVIGKRRAASLQTHAWVEWDTQVGTWLLDPTFNWMATQEVPDGSSYIPFYAYAGAYKYQAANFALSNHSKVAHRLVAPSQGARSAARHLRLRR